MTLSTNERAVAPGDVLDVQPGERAVIPVNLTLRTNGDAVMGAGLARAAARRFPGSERELGTLIQAVSPRPLEEPLALWLGRVFLSERFPLLYVPTKTDWRQPTPLALLEANVQALGGHPGPLRVPPLGCGLGGVPLSTFLALAARHLPHHHRVMDRR